MHEHNDQALHRPAHGRAPFGTLHSPLGLERYDGEIESASGPISVRFEGREGPRVTICHPDPFFRALECAWNDQPDFGQRDVHARFWGLTEPEISAGFDFQERVALVSDFLTLGASALEALSQGQRAEIASLEEHAGQLQLTTPHSHTMQREVL